MALWEIVAAVATGVAIRDGVAVVVASAVATPAADGAIEGVLDIEDARRASGQEDYARLSLTFMHRSRRWTVTGLDDEVRRRAA